MRITAKELTLYLLPIPIIVISLLIGPSEQISSKDVFNWIVSKISISTSYNFDENLLNVVILEVRLPRIILAFLTGSALTMSGTSMQALFRNPLVSPDILGLSAGAAFGASLALTIPSLPVQITAFIFGFSAVGISYFLAIRRGSISNISLILAGVIVSGIFTSALTIVKFLTDPFKLQTIVHWTMGNLHNATWKSVSSSAPLIILGGVWLFIMRWRMNVIALGDEETKSVGLSPEREKLLILIPSTLVATASVAVTGIIGMVGLAVPHMVRMIVGPNNMKALPISCFFGGTFLLVVDDFSRAITSFEIPIGIFTTLIGGPFFIYLLKKNHFSFGEE